MNREIKFRAWNGEGMVDLYSTTKLALASGFNIDGLFIPFHKDYILMQFTGLLDKNSKEIYEGDVVNIGSSDFGFIKNEKGENVEYEVKHEGCDYILYRNDLKLKWGRLSRLEELFWQCEVIGNIYEKPNKGGDDE